MVVVGDIDPDEYYQPMELAKIKASFKKFDTSGDGSLQAEELLLLFKSMGIHVKPYQLEMIIKEFDADGSGEIDYDEFLALMIKLLNKKVRADQIDFRQYLTDEVIEQYQKMFNKMDSDMSGALGKKEINEMFIKQGLKLSSDQLDSIINEVDRDKSGEIEFEEFCCMMAKLKNFRKRIQPREYLDPEELLRMRQAFDYFDSSGDGTISALELDSLLRKLNTPVATSKIGHLLEKYDEDKSGELDFYEFCSMMVDLKKKRKKRKINPNTTSAGKLRLEGFTAFEVKQAGFTAKQLKEGNFECRSMVDAEFRPLDLRRAGWSAKDLREGGLGPGTLKRCGFSLTELAQAGFSSAACRASAQACLGQIEKVPNFDERRYHRAPKQPDCFTPRIRFFTDEGTKPNKGLVARDRFVAAGKRISMSAMAKNGGGTSIAALVRTANAMKRASESAAELQAHEQQKSNSVVGDVSKSVGRMQEVAI